MRWRMYGDLSTASAPPKFERSPPFREPDCGFCGPLVELPHVGVVEAGEAVALAAGGVVLLLAIFGVVSAGHEHDRKFVQGVIAMGENPGTSFFGGDFH